MIREMAAGSLSPGPIKPIEKAAGEVVGGKSAKPYLRRPGQASTSRDPKTQALVMTTRRLTPSETSPARRMGPRFREDDKLVTATAQACPSRSASRPRCGGAPRHIGRP